jgi:hypothetical protein
VSRIRVSGIVFRDDWFLFPFCFLVVGAIVLLTTLMK